MCSRDLRGGSEVGFVVKTEKGLGVCVMYLWKSLRLISTCVIPPVISTSGGGGGVLVMIVGGGGDLHGGGGSNSESSLLFSLSSFFDFFIAILTELRTLFAARDFMML